MQGRVTLVWRVHANGREEPWVMVAESAALRLAAERRGDAGRARVGGGVDDGMGLYTWKRFERDEAIGHYTGTEHGPYDAQDEDSIAAAIGYTPCQPGGAIK